MPYARADDRVRIYYEETGRGVPLVLAYGIGGSTTSWDTNVAALACRHRVIVWDPRGHGRSDNPADPARYSFTRWALDLRDLLRHLAQQFDFFGDEAVVLCPSDVQGAQDAVVGQERQTAKGLHAARQQPARDF